jgi:hypothetical protein
MEANPGVGLPRLWVTGAKQQPLQMWVHVTGVKGPLQMLHELFEVFTYVVVAAPTGLVYRYWRPAITADQSKKPCMLRLGCATSLVENKTRRFPRIRGSGADSVPQDLPRRFRGKSRYDPGSSSRAHFANAPTH